MTAPAIQTSPLNALIAQLQAALAGTPVADAAVEDTNGFSAIFESAGEPTEAPSVPFAGKPSAPPQRATPADPEAQPPALSSLAALFVVVPPAPATPLTTRVALDESVARGDEAGSGPVELSGDFLPGPATVPVGVAGDGAPGVEFPRPIDETPPLSVPDSVPGPVPPVPVAKGPATGEPEPDAPLPNSKTPLRDAASPISGEAVEAPVQRSATASAVQDASTQPGTAKPDDKPAAGAFPLVAAPVRPEPHPIFRAKSAEVLRPRAEAADANGIPQPVPAPTANEPVPTAAPEIPTAAPRNLAVAPSPLRVEQPKSKQTRQAGATAVPETPVEAPDCAPLEVQAAPAPAPFTQSQPPPMGEAPGRPELPAAHAAHPQPEIATPTPVATPGRDAAGMRLAFSAQITQMPADHAISAPPPSSSVAPKHSSLAPEIVLHHPDESPSEVSPEPALADASQDSGRSIPGKRAAEGPRQTDRPDSASPDRVEPQPRVDTAPVLAAADRRVAPQPTSEPPSTAATARPDVAAEPPKPATIAREIKLQVDGPDQRVELRMVDRGGDIRIAVRTPDQHLAGALRQELPTLAARLEQNGFRAEAWHTGQSGDDRPRVADSQGAAPQGRDERQQQGGREPDDQQQQQQAERRTPTETARKDNRKDFAWLFTSLR